MMCGSLSDERTALLFVAVTCHLYAAVLLHEFQHSSCDGAVVVSAVDYHIESCQRLTAVNTVVPRYTSVLRYEPPSERYFALR
jgi:hypothetical protein